MSQGQQDSWPALADGQLSLEGDVVVSARDEGLLRGDGVYEVIRVYNHVPFALREHLQRLVRSCGLLHIDPQIGTLEREVDQLVQAIPADVFDIRIVLTRGGRRLLLAEPPRIVGGLLRLLPVVYAPPIVLDGAKTLSYCANMRAGRIAREEGFDEALLITPDGSVLEAPTASVFWTAADGVLRTPPLDVHILDSITRRLVIKLLDAAEQHTTLADLHRAEEAFLASTTREVQSIQAIGTTRLRAPGPITQAAREAFDLFVSEHTGLRKVAGT